MPRLPSLDRSRISPHSTDANQSSGSYFLALQSNVNLGYPRTRGEGRGRQVEERKHCGSKRGTQADHFSINQPECETSGIILDL